jgi:hypothetical protein
MGDLGVRLNRCEKRPRTAPGPLNDDPFIRLAPHQCGFFLKRKDLLQFDIAINSSADDRQAVLPEFR